MTLVFGLLTAFIPGLAYVEVYITGPTHLGQTYPYVACFPFEFQIHGFTFGLLVSSVGGILGLTSALRRGNKLVYLAFIGDFLGILGFLFYPPTRYSIIPEIHFFDVPWVGVCLTLIGISMMTVGCVVKCRGWHRLTVLGIPLLLASWLIYPLLITVNNLPLLLSIHRSVVRNTLPGILLGVPGVLVGVFLVLGFALTLLGSAIGVWKFGADLKGVFHAPS